MLNRAAWAVLATTLILVGCSSFGPELETGLKAPEVERIPPGWTLVTFGADWCPNCRKLEPELAKLSAVQPDLQVKSVDVEKRTSLEYQTTYRKYFHGRAIPYTVLVDSNGRARKNWVGYLHHSELMADILAVERNQAKETPR